jgi:hypothetical protein
VSFLLEEQRVLLINHSHSSILAGTAHAWLVGGHKGDVSSRCTFQRVERPPAHRIGTLVYPPVYDVVSEDGDYTPGFVLSHCRDRAGSHLQV